MEKVGDLMRDLGFKEDSSDEVKKAFIRNLMRAAFPDAKPHSITLAPSKTEPEQLQFTFEEKTGA